MSVTVIMDLFPEISKGDVFFENNNLLCYATANIYWADILASSQQGIRIHNDVSRSRSCKLCRLKILISC